VAHRPPGAAGGFPGSRSAVVIGLGLIGRQVASRLETLGVDVSLVDLSPVNLQPLAQLGFATRVGDASDPSVLREVGADRAAIVVVTVPNDEAAAKVLASVRALNKDAAILVRCRYQTSVSKLRRMGADEAVSEEAVASGPLLRLCEERVARLNASAGAGSFAGSSRS
jgi:CPA2 family monovalent cation:H+ antiporter-2